MIMISKVKASTCIVAAKRHTIYSNMNYGISLSDDLLQFDNIRMGRSSKRLDNIVNA